MTLGQRIGQYRKGPGHLSGGTGRTSGCQPPGGEQVGDGCGHSGHGKPVGAIPHLRRICGGTDGHTGFARSGGRTHGSRILPLPHRRRPKTWVVVLIGLAGAGWFWRQPESGLSGQISDPPVESRLLRDEQPDMPETDFLPPVGRDRTKRNGWHLGQQEGFFPFGTSLALTESEDVTDNTDMHLTTLHQADCGAIQITYLPHRL